MTTATLLLNRRTRVERRVLAMVRGEYGETMRVDHAESFAQLKAVMSSQGLNISAIGTPYLSPDELALLTWIADAQRVASTRRMPEDQAMVASIRRCARTLLDMRLRLSALSLYNECRAGTGPDQRR